MKSLPTISVITSTFNCRDDLVKTIESIKAQTAVANIQWILADGGSTDGTVDLIRDHLGIIDVWFSEPDEGIYDAWNKAIPHVRGEWVQFVGAGDEYYNQHVIEKVLPILQDAHPTYDLVYGRLQYITQESREPRDVVGEPWCNLKGRWEFFRPKLPIHPEVFHHRSLFEKFKFDSKYKIAGDSHFLMRCIRFKDPLYVPLIIDKMPLGGKSGSLRHIGEAAREVKQVSKELGYKVPYNHYAIESIKLAAKRACCFLLSDYFLYKVANFYRLVSGKKKRW